MKILHIVATPRGRASNTLRVSEAFLTNLQTQRDNVTIDVVDLFEYDLPAVAGDNIEAKYTLMFGQPIDRSHEKSWRQIEKLIGHFLSADAYVISAPMWNLGIPYMLKYYIDCIVQPGYLFRYDEGGQPVPLVHGKKMLCVTSHGGDYSPGRYLAAHNFLEPYLRAIFGFVGIYDIEFISAQSMDVTPDLRAAALGAAVEQAEQLGASAAWTGSAVVGAAA
jgi:FMN-dependent NADH-azoreductase